MIRLTVILVTTAVVVLGVIFYLQQGKTSTDITQNKTPHFLDSTPLHGETYASQPINVTLNFDFDLATESEISVTSTNNKEWTVGEVIIEDNKTALKKDLEQNMPDGSYLVLYKACWFDKSCHEGQFSFKIDSSKVSEYQGMRKKQEVTIDMENIKFNPAKIVISPGTKVVWKNLEEAGHFINTESHPEHTYFPEQNSTEIKKGGDFSLVFEKPGQYNYHCSAHVPQGMLGSIIVAN